MSTINDVKSFWEENPLWTGESEYEAGSKNYFDEHRTVVIDDCFAGKIDKRIFPEKENDKFVLDLGCGPGFWIVELAKNGCERIVAADITNTALKLTKKRCEIYGVAAEYSLQNAEKLTFADNLFSHVNCQGVIHHTPDTQACVKEIARVLEKEGTASISVYYKNVFLKYWSKFHWIGKFFNKMGARLIGRGRENIYTIGDADEIVRLYDGDKNPIGKCYSKNEFIAILDSYFDIDDIYFHFFPKRSLPIYIPNVLHKFLDKYCGFMMYAVLRKK